MNDEQLEIVFQLFDQILHALFIRGIVDKKFLDTMLEKYLWKLKEA